MSDSTAYLSHIRDAILRVREYTRGGREAFMQSTLVQDAVIRNLAVIGEAVKQVPEEWRVREPNVPWKSIAGMRDLLVHHYFGVELEIVWNVVEEHLEPLRAAVERLLVDKTGA